MLAQNRIHWAGVFFYVTDQEAICPVHVSYTIGYCPERGRSPKQAGNPLLRHSEHRAAILTASSYSCSLGCVIMDHGGLYPLLQTGG